VRNQHGASILLVAACAVLLIFAAYFGFRYCMLLGGSNEVRNAVDAAALNVSKRASEIKVPATGTYNDCGDNYHQIGLANINRVWGKAFLINANQQDMLQTGTAGGASGGNAETAYAQAQNINDLLAQQLKNKENLDAYFNKLASTRPANMLSKDATVKTTSQNAWATSMVDRGAESNLSYTPGQLPPSVHVNGVNKGGNLYFGGYSPLQTNSQSFCFTPFKVGEMPHLISDTYFDQNRGDTNPIPNARNPIPNAYRESGQADSGTVSLAAAASAVANPMRQYKLAIPYAYVSIQFNNTAKWIVEGKKVNQTQYGCVPEEQWGAKKVPLPPPPASSGGTLDGYASLGNEYKRADVWDSINALPANHMPALQKVLQRIQEFQPHYTINQLEQLMLHCNLDPAAPAYYIFPTYKSGDLTDPSVQMQPSTGALPPWLNQIAPDGTEMQVMPEGSEQDEPNVNWENIVGGKKPTGEHRTICSGGVFWTPGTGFSQCLGVLRMARETDCYFSGQ
jgi:hypothetical protein